MFAVDKKTGFKGILESCLYSERHVFFLRFPKKFTRYNSGSKSRKIWVNRSVVISPRRVKTLVPHRITIFGSSVKKGFKTRGNDSERLIARLLAIFKAILSLFDQLSLFDYDRM